MSKLLIDAGNSALKWSVINAKNQLSRQHTIFYTPNLTPIQVFTDVIALNKAECDSVLMVSVLGDSFNQDALSVAHENQLKLNNLRSLKTLGNIKNAYTIPENLGTDRLVAMVAAYDLVNKNQTEPKACLIIDSGTATTIDAVDSKGYHLGGLILTGHQLSQNSLLKNTQLIPEQTHLTNKTIQPALFAKDTATAIKSGAVLGLSGAISDICQKMEKCLEQSSNPAKVVKVICGGGYNELRAHLDSSFQHKPDLLMHGLQVISNFLEEEK